MIFPAIDIMDGGCVRLFKGDFDQRTDYAPSPMEVAKGYAADGAEWMHVVDLDGAKRGSTEQADLIISLAQDSGLRVQTGGGLRELYHIQRLLDGGVERAVIGSLAITNPNMVKFWLSELGPEKIVLALDVKVDEAGMPYPTTHGWTQTAEQNLWETLDSYMGAGLKTLLATDIAKDGVLGGSNVALYKDIMKRYPDLELITSGGVGTLEHVKSLKAINPYGIIIGKALFEGRFSVAEAIAC